ncbi:MAG: prepilin-type N-terminal cleavage/methylation domain-containing protein [Candidatus Eremiobacterota bacterium]
MFYIKKKISLIKGFTLAEIMLAMFLLGIVMVTVTGVFVSGLSGARKAQKKIITLNLAESMLDSILLMDYSDIDAGTYNGTTTKSNIDGDAILFPPDPSAQDIESKIGAIYKITVEQKGTVATIKKITVEVLIKGIQGEGSSKAKLVGFKAQ